jgi:hypothetical protein
MDDPGDGEFEVEADSFYEACTEASEKVEDRHIDGIILSDAWQTPITT